MSKYQALIDALKAGPTEGKWRKSKIAEVMIGTRRLCNVTAAESLPIGKDVERANINATYIAAANPATIRSLLADLEMAEKDAERYRFLRSQHEDSDSICSLCVFEPINDQTLEPIGCMPGELDSAIDAALSQLKGVQ